MDVTLPDGTVIQNVPDGTTKDQLVTKLKSNGYDVSWYKPSTPGNADASAVPVMPEALPQAKKQMSPLAQGIVDLSPAKALYGLAETGSQMVTGAAGQVLGGLRGLGTLLTGGGLDKAVEKIRGTEEALTYKPHSAQGKQISEAIAYPFTEFNEGAGKIGEYYGGAGGRTVGENLLPVLPVAASFRPMMRQARAAAAAKNQFKVPVRDETTGQITYLDPEKVGFARENPAKLEAHELARKHGIVTDPYSTNPTKGNEIRTGLVNRDQLAHDLSGVNESRWGTVLKEDIGIRPNAPLNDIETFRAVRENAARPAVEIARTGGQMYLTDGQIAELNALRRESTIARPGIESQMDNLVNRSLDRLGVGDPDTFAHGLPAGDMLREIADLRKVARDIYKRKDAGTEEIANADAYLKIANTIEEAVENNLTWQAERNPYGNAGRLLDDYREGRRTMAKSYALEDATDMATGVVDPNKLAAIAAKDNALTGAFADVGKIAANFPEAARLSSPVKGMMQTRLYRSSVPGIAGTILGSMFGPIGASAGGIAGAGLGEIIGRSMSHRLRNPERQNLGVNPVPRELWEFSGDPLTRRFEYGDSQMGREFVPPTGGEPPMLPPPAPPAGPRGPVEGAPAPYRHPNFQFGENNPPQPAPPGTAMTRGEPLTPEQQWAQDKANFAAQDRTMYEREAALDALAMQKAEAEAAALRQPAGEGVVLGGGDRPAPVRMEPLVVTPTALQSAVDKISKGRAFDLTAEERIAWSKAKGTIETLRNVKE